MEKHKRSTEPEKSGGMSVASLREQAADVPINPSGHRQEVDRNFNLLSICALAITSGNSWVTLGGAVTVAIYNGGPPGILYEFIAAAFFYWFIAASIAELASAMPSAGGVYHWASVTAGKYGRVCGWFAGWWNFFAWVVGLASILQITAAQTVSMYSAFHPDFVTQRWHVFVSYIICTWVTCLIVLFANRALPTLEQIGGFLVLAGVFVSIVVCAVMPHVRGRPYATTSFVWRDWVNSTGYSSDGFVFLLGMLNGAFSVGTPDVVSHLAEEIPRPSSNIPRAILFQFIVSFFTAFFYGIAILYTISDLDAVLDSNFLFPLAAIYRQATGSSGGTLGLLIIVFLPTFFSGFGCYLTSSRVFWTLARDNATPFSEFFGRVDPKHKNPFNSIALCGVVCTVLGCIYLGSSTAFSALVGSYVVLSTLSYLAAILPHLLSKRSIAPGRFWMKGPVGYVVNVVSCLFIMVIIVIFCFPFFLPVDAKSMNYTSLITGGFSLFIAAFYVWRQKDYVGPKYVPLEADVLAKDAI